MTHSSFGHQHPEGNRPDHQEKPRFSAADIAPGDSHTLATLLASALDDLAQHRWTSFDVPTKRILDELRLITRPQFEIRYQTTKEFSDLYDAIKALPFDGRVLALRAILAAHDQFGPTGAGVTATHIGLFTSPLRERFGNETNLIISHFRKLTLAFIENKHLGLNTFGNLLGESLKERSLQTLLSHALLIHFTTQNPDEQASTLRFLRDEGQHNDVPFLDHVTYENDRRDARERARNVITRTLKYGLYAFDRLSSETRRPGRETPSLFHEFGKETFEDCFRLYTSNNDRTPGAGYYLSGPKLDKLFFSTKKSKKAYEDSFGTYGKAFEQLRDTTFFFMRGGIVVFHRDPEYRLPISGETDETGKYKKTEPYCLYIANDHFTGGLDLAALLPAKIVQRYIMPAIQFDDVQSSPGSHSDLAQPGFNLDSLAKLSLEAGLPPLMIANISTGFGGMVAAYPKGSAPYYSWEPDLDKASLIWRDARKRVHHAWYVRTADSFRNGGTQEEAARLRIEILKPLAEGCKKVATAAEGLLNILDLLTFRYDAWKVDLTPSTQQTPRMLQKAAQWHRSLHARKAPEKDFPFLCRVNRYNWNQPPEIVLDTFSWELNLGDGKTRKLPPLPGGQEVAEMLWARVVAPRVTFIDGERRAETDSTLVFLPRDLVV
jgi:hypothetical protein